MRLSRKNFPFYLLLRLSRTLFFYGQLKRFVNSKKIRLVFSTDGNPHGNAIMALSDSKLVETVFVAHAADSIQPLRLRCSHAYFFGRHSFESAIQNYSKIRHVEFFKFESELGNITFDSPKRIGIFLSKDFNEDSLKSLVNKVFDRNQDSSVILRLHPGSLINLSLQFDSRVKISRNNSIANDLKECDVVVGGNSTVLLECLLSGVCSYFWKELDRYSEFTLPTIRQGLIYNLQKFDSQSLETGKSLYRTIEWRKKLNFVFNLHHDSTNNVQI